MYQWLEFNDNIYIQVEFIFEDIITLFSTKHIQPLKYYIKTNWRKYSDYKTLVDNFLS